MFKIVKGYETLIEFVSIQEDRKNRGHEVTLAKEQSRLHIRKFLEQLERITS